MNVLISILLLLLKIIGILLLVVLVLLALVLLVPIRYSAGGTFNDEEKKADARVSWLLKFLQVKVHFDQDAETKLTKQILICGIDPQQVKEKKEQKKKEKRVRVKKEKLKKLKEEDPETYEQLREEAKARKEEAKAKKEERKKSASQPAAAAAARPPEVTEEIPGIIVPDRRKKPPKLLQKLGELGSRVSGIIGRLFGLIGSFLPKVMLTPAKLSDVLAGAVTKVQEILGKAGEIKDFACDIRTRRAIRLILKRVRQILAHVLPGKAEGNITYGLDDPGTTGTAAAAVSVVKAFALPDLTLTPDFERKVVDGQAKLTGRIRLGYLVWLGILTILNRNVLFVLKTLKNMKKEAPSEAEDEAEDAA